MNNINSDSISASTIGKWYVIAISGDFTIKNLTRIRKWFDEAEINGVQFIALDLSTTTYLDSSGITILVNFRNRSIRRGATMVLAGLNTDIEEIISILGIDKILKVIKNINDLPQES